MTHKWKSYVDRTCEACGVQFRVQYQATRRENGARFCSPACTPGHNSHLLKYIASPLGPANSKVERECPTCGARFFTKVKNITRGGGKYCSRRCNKNIAPAEPKSVKARRYNLKKNYGLTVAAYGEMVGRQNGLCAICNEPPNPNVHSGKLYVDHDHDTGAVRQLLCGHCNWGLGHFKDSPGLLLKAYAYLVKHGRSITDDNEADALAILHLAMETAT